MLAVDLGDDVARLDAGLLGRAAGLDAAHQRADRLAEADRLGDLLASPGAMTTPMRPRITRPPARSCSDDAHRLVDRDRERDAHVAARAAVDLRVDADHLAAHVDQRAAGVAGVDRDVGLDQRQQVAGVARLGADDAGGDGALEAERRADRDHPLADLELARRRRSAPSAGRSPRS